MMHIARAETDLTARLFPDPLTVEHRLSLLRIEARHLARLLRLARDHAHATSSVSERAGLNAERQALEVPGA